MSQSHKFAYFGTPSVAAKTLEGLVSRNLVPVLVITAPNAPRGRGLVLTPSETRVVAESHGIPVLMPPKLDGAAIAAIREHHCDYAVVVAYGKIFPQELIDAFPKGAINVHYSLLPKYRGATPMETALLAGDTETGVTVQQMAYELDSGNILAQEATPIGADETARELRPRLIDIGTRLLVETLSRLEQGEITPMPQDSAHHKGTSCFLTRFAHNKTMSLATRARKFKKADGELDLSAPGEENWRKYRAYADTIGTYFFKDGTRYKITRASFKNGHFTVERVIPEGKRETDWQA
ncbi:MAG: methionyl-tRNA formyltransferase [bacterium]|nr:methionyl-tRNA formyltransferase [bacterium]